MSNISSLLKPYENPNPDVILSGRSPRRISLVQRKVPRSSFGSPPGPGPQTESKILHLALFEMWDVGSQPHPKPRRHREAAQAVAAQAVATQGLPTKDLSIPTTTKSNSCHPEQSEGSAVLSIRKPGCPTSRAFEMWILEAAKDHRDQSTDVSKRFPVYGEHPSPPPSRSNRTTRPHHRTR